MPAILSSPQDCCKPCPEPLVQNIPGVPGSNGADGANGADGLPSYTTTTAAFFMPAELATVSVEVVSSDWAVIGQIVFVGVGGVYGWFQVTGKVDSQHMTLLNVANGATDAYQDNAAPGTVFAPGAQVSPGGEQGPAGTNGTSGAPVGATYITQTPNGTLTNEQPLSILATGLMRVTTATGVVDSVAEGVANGAHAANSAALTNGDAVFASATGIETKTAANALAALGIAATAIAKQLKNAVDFTGGTIAGTTISTSAVSATTLAASGATALSGIFSLIPTALQTVAAANLITPSGKIRVAGNGGPVVMTSTPTIALGTVDGEMCLVQGTHDTNTVQLQDNGSLAGSKLRLGAANRTLGAGDSVLLSWDTTLGFWCEVAFTDLV